MADNRHGKAVINLATGHEDGLVGNAKLAGATPLWEWIGDGATVFSY